MLAFVRRPRRRAAGVSVFLVAAALGAAAIGCGSGGDTTPAETAGATAGGPDRPGTGDAGSSAGQSSERGQAKGADGGKDGSGPAGDAKRDGNGASGAAAAGEPTPAGTVKSRGQKKQGQPVSTGDQRSIERVAAKHCPKGLDLSQCKALVQGSKQTQDTPSYVITEPDDCVKAMGQAECEALYKAQKEAEGGESADVQKCLQNPTPRCEAILRPVFEQQRAAEEASK